MKYATVNPCNNEMLKEFPFSTYPDLDVSSRAFQLWRKLSVEERGKQLNKVAELLEKNKAEYARLITLEMGKPLREAEYEINKTISTFDYYINNAPAFLQAQVIPSNASKSYVLFEPMGIIFSIMPWNFPFWQVFRFAIPTLIAGNVTILKHAPNVPQCALAIENLFKEAGFAEGIFRNLFFNNDDAGRLIAEPRVMGISFTGSDATGSILAAQAGKHIKKCVMELGGNDAFIVLADADLDFTVQGAIKSRSINTGQSCNGAKRFIVVEETNTGPLARKDLQQKVLQQISDSVQQGAVPHYGMAVDTEVGNFVSPVVLTNVKAGMRAFEEEIFGPVWSVITVKNQEEAITIANQSVYGLGASVWTNDKTKAEQLVTELEVGNVFINDIVKSDPRLPFGGFKRSGFGRELSEYGLKEFVNIKTVYIN
jgi:succinate-semialdehyde dehydrogenase/glutarate-semialdehyde dehydrogenase